MVRLIWSTPREWVERVSARPLELLSDHAHCEMKAASSAQALVGKYAVWHGLVQVLCEVAREELAHFAFVTRLLHSRGGELLPLMPNPYAAALLRQCRSGARDHLLDRLLVSALIEARSLERFLLLAEHLADGDLARLYGSLAPSEAAHQALFLDLARRHFPVESVNGRLDALILAEGDIIAALPFDFRMHSGLATALPRERDEPRSRCQA